MLNVQQILKTNKTKWMIFKNLCSKIIFKRCCGWDHVQFFFVLAVKSLKISLKKISPKIFLNYIVANLHGKFERKSVFQLFISILFKKGYYKMSTNLLGNLSPILDYCPFPENPFSEISFNKNIICCCVQETVTVTVTDRRTDKVGI